MEELKLEPICPEKEVDLSKASQNIGDQYCWRKTLLRAGVGEKLARRHVSTHLRFMLIFLIEKRHREGLK